jgi:hypothetical protein
MNPPLTHNQFFHTQESDIELHDHILKEHKFLTI